MSSRRTSGYGAGKTRHRTSRTRVAKTAPGRSASGLPARRKATKTGSGSRGVGGAKGSNKAMRNQRACVASVAVVEELGATRDSVRTNVRIPLWNPAAARIAARRHNPASRSGRRAANFTRHSNEVFAALGNSSRVNILQLLLDGPATYRALQRATGLAAGPLYHHVNQLRLAGLVLPKQRDLYELTRGGRNLYVVAVALASLVRDSRRRPFQA